MIVFATDIRPSTGENKIMQISMLTAMEIYTNPRDLEIAIWKPKGGTKFGFIVSRGPLHGFKLILSTRPFANTAEEVITRVKQELESICFNLTKGFTDNNSIPLGYRDPITKEIDQSKVLNPDLIERIVSELRCNGVASTNKI